MENYGQLTREEEILLNSELRFRNKKIITAYVRLAFSPFFGFHRSYYEKDKGWMFPVLFWVGFLLRLFKNSSFLIAVGTILEFAYAILVLVDIYKLNQWHEEYTETLKHEITNEIIELRDRSKLSALDRVMINDEIDHEVGHLETAYIYAERLSSIFGFHRRYLGMPRPWIFTLLSVSGIIFLVMGTIGVGANLISVIGTMNPEMIDFLLPSILSSMSGFAIIMLVGLILFAAFRIILAVDKFKIDNLIVSKRYALKMEKTDRRIAELRAEEERARQEAFAASVQASEGEKTDSDDEEVVDVDPSDKEDVEVVDVEVEEQPVEDVEIVDVEEPIVEEPVVEEAEVEIVDVDEADIEDVSESIIDEADVIDVEIVENDESTADDKTEN